MGHSLNTCTKCGETKPFELFVKDKRIKSGYSSECKECKNVRSSVAYFEDPEKRKGWTEAWLAEPENQDKVYWSWRKKGWRDQGIADVDTLEWVDILESQDYKCKVCGKPVDMYTAWREHDHETGLTRGAVCGSTCNAAMDGRIK